MMSLLKRLCLLLFAGYLIAACGDKVSQPEVRFENPQPDNVDNEKSIPKKLIGSYQSLSNASSVLEITPIAMIRHTTTNLKGMRQDFDSAFMASIKGDTILNEQDGIFKVTTTLKGDSAFQDIHMADTVFGFTSRYTLRKMKGYYFISRHDLNNWYVWKLGKTKTGLILAEIFAEEDIKLLRELTNTPSDTVFNFNPSRRTLRKYLKNDGFSTEEHFIKL